MDVTVNDAGAPALLTERLLLRPLRAGDEAAYTAILADPLNVRYLPGGAAGAARAAEKARHLIEHWGAAAWADGCRPWGVELRDGALIGHLGLRFVPELGETELLYLLDRPHWGRGLATEGARAAIGFARERLGLRYLVALAVAENTASTAVMRRCGFAFEGPMHVFGLDAVRYGRRLQTAGRDRKTPLRSIAGTFF